MDGWKTVLTGALMAVAPALSSYFEAVDWSFLDPTVAFFVSGAIMIGLRFVTTGPIFNRSGE